MTAKQRKFDALIAIFHADMYRYAVWLCRDPVLAQDVVQETMLRAWRALDRLRDEGAAKQWLITILRRELARHYQRSRAPAVELESLPIADDAPGPDDNMEAEVLRRHIARLEDDYREPLVLQVLMGFSVEEIATTMELKQATVLTRLFRARKQLAATLVDAGLTDEWVKP